MLIKFRCDSLNKPNVSLEWRTFSPDYTEKPREACFDPGNIMNASRMGYDYKLGSQVSYNCHHGYITVGAETITCVMGNDGKPVWDKALPTCKGKGEAHCESCINVFVRSGCASQFAVKSTTWSDRCAVSFQIMPALFFCVSVGTCVCDLQFHHSREQNHGGDTTKA